MLNYMPRQLQKKLQENNINSINELRRQKANKYEQTLQFMTEWSNDLLEREHELTKNQQSLNHQLLQLEAKRKTFRSQKTHQSLRQNTQNQIDIHKMVEREFIKKLQQVYTKQIIMYESSQPQNQTFSSEQSSHQQSVQSQSQYESQNHKRLSSNFSNYFNGFECHTDTKNNQHSVGSENISKASQLIQQQYFSNSVHEEPSYCQIENNSRHQETYEENFISY